MEVRFLVDIDPEQKAGLFNAVVARVACMPQSVNYNLSYFDTATIRLAKKILGIRAKEKKPHFELDGIVFAPLHVRADILYYLAKLIGPLIPIVFHRDSKRILKMIGPGHYILSAHWGITSGVLAHYICRQTGERYVVTYHGSDINNLHRRSIWLRRIVLKSLRDSKTNIFVSKALLAKARTLGYDKDNSIVIYNGVEKNKFASKKGNVGFKRICTTTEFFVGSPVVGFVGSMLPVKGADFLPNICREILAKEPNTKFLFAGDGELLGSIKSAVDKNKVVVLGQVDSEDIVAVMHLQQMDIC